MFRSHRKIQDGILTAWEAVINVVWKGLILLITDQGFPSRAYSFLKYKKQMGNFFRVTEFLNFNQTNQTKQIDIVFWGPPSSIRRLNVYLYRVILPIASPRVDKPYGPWKFFLALSNFFKWLFYVTMNYDPSSKIHEPIIYQFSLNSFSKLSDRIVDNQYTISI